MSAFMQAMPVFLQGIPEPLLLAVFFIVPILPSMWAIRHVHGHVFRTPLERSLWFALTVFIPILGGILYILFGRRYAQTAPKP